MEGKVLLQDLAQSLAVKRNSKLKDAEVFMKAFFETISEGILQDKIVKIKGLGTFKMIEVQERESVNVNTGERIVIPGHSKISFTPDNELKDQVNRPFALFQTVVINEGTSLEDMEKFDEQTSLNDGLVETEVPNTPETQEISETPETTEIPDVPETPETQDVSETTEIPEEPNAPEAQEVQKEEKLSTVNSQLSTSEEHKWWHISPAMLGLLFAFFWIVLLVGYFIGKYNCCDIDKIFNKNIQEPTVVVDTVFVVKRVEPDSAYIKAIEDSLKNVILSVRPIQKEQPKVVASQAEKAAPKPVAEKKPIPAAKKQGPVAYEIVGLKGTRTIKWGDYLLKIVREEYGTEDALRYVISYNKFTDPNNVPVGTEVNLPKLREK